MELTRRRRIRSAGNSGNETQQQEEHETDEEADGFDYLAYARDRAAFFWGDVLSLGIMKEAELPEEVVKGAKILDY